MKKESELRQATILFADISGFTAMSEKMSPEEVTAIMNSVFKMMGYIIEQYEGRIDKFIGDCVMATFGVPTAIENAPNKAVNTAIELRNKLYQFNKSENLKIPLDIHIGINSGNVLAGEVGSDQKKEYTVMGDTVNLAARLEDASQTGQILVGLETYRSTKSEFEYRELKPIKLKGKEKPVSVFELVSQKEKIHYRLTTDRIIQSVMVGREAEMDKLELAVAHAKNGEGSIVNVIGEAGIGKSRLIAELKNSDVVKRTMVLEGRALSMGRNLSFYPIIRILKGFAGISEDDSESTQRQKLETAIRNIHPEEADEIYPFIATLMGMKLTGKYAERVEGIEGEAKEKHIYKNIRALILKSAEVSPLIFIIEDLHWADTSSIVLIISLFRLIENNRILIINVFRPYYKETGEVLRKATNEEFFNLSEEIQLQSLSVEQSGLLIDNLLKIEGIPEKIRNHIKEKSGGNPFFIEEMIRSMIDEGAIEMNDGKIGITDKIDSVVVPNTIQELLMSRIDRLDEDTKSLLRTSSVIGRHFFHKILKQVADAVGNIDVKLGYLKEIQLIREGKRMDEVEYLFKHALAQEAVYESILLQKRKELHLRVAESIEKTFSERLHEFYGMLAYHFNQGGDQDKTETYMEKAGEEAMKASATNEAIEYYMKALELYSDKYGADVDPHKIALIEKNIATAFHTRGNHTEAVNYFDRSLKNLGIKEYGNRISLMMNLLFSLFIFLKSIYYPPKKQKTVLTDLDMQVMEILMKRGMSLIIFDLERTFIESILLFKLALRRDWSGHQIGYNANVGMGALFILGGISFRIGQKAIEYVRTSIKIQDERVSPYLYEYMQEIYNICTGDLSDDFNESIVKDGCDLGDFFNVSAYLEWAGLRNVEKGDFKGADEMIEKLEILINEYGYAHAQLDYYDVKSALHIQRFDYDKSTECINSAIRVSEKLGEDAFKISFLGQKLKAEIKNKSLDTADNTMSEAEKLIKKIGKNSVMPHWYSRYVIGAALYRLAKLENLLQSDEKSGLLSYKKLASKAIKEAEKTGKKYAPTRTQSLRIKAVYFWCINKQNKALKWFNKSIKEVERLGARPELSRTYFEIGKRLLEPKSKYKQLNGITAEEYLEKARVLFEEMGLKWDLEQLEKLRNQA
ncbi:AAA family ATPase [bacterium]|nr:AAA family ATPase [bacterium]